MNGFSEFSPSAVVVRKTEKSNSARLAPCWAEKRAFNSVKSCLERGGDTPLTLDQLVMLVGKLEMMMNSIDWPDLLWAIRSSSYVLRTTS